MVQSLIKEMRLCRRMRSTMLTWWQHLMKVTLKEKGYPLDNMEVESYEK